MMKFLLSLSAFLLLSAYAICQPGGSGQNNTCQTATPFCTGTLYNFPAGVNAGSGQSGPCYNCLATRPNPAWYYMKIDQPGSITIKMYSVPSKDIDFCCWGPFTSQNCCSELTCNKVVDCSYSPAATEYCDIPNGQTGQYYMLVITNFSNDPCNIIFSQTGGTGTTDCTILPPPCSNNSPLCIGQTIQLTASSVANASYRWSGPNNFHSTQQNPSIPNAQPANAGDYYLKITVSGQPSADSTRTTVLIYQPVANAGNDTTISNGVFTQLHGSGSQGSGSYKYIWAPSNLLTDSTAAAPTTTNLFETTIFKLKVIDDSASCAAEDFVTINIAGGALAVNGIANPSTICAGATTQLHAYGSGGTGNYTYHWTGPNGFTSNLADPTVQPTSTSVYTVEVNDGFNTRSNFVNVVVNALPIANTGNNLVIPYGTYTYLTGSVTGPPSSYFYSWTPADKLVNANTQNPQTIGLTNTTIYSLIVTNLVTNCHSENQANTTVEVAGGPLNTNPAATPAWICRGDTTQLHALAGGGNVGFYQYTWSSNPPGFTSTEPDPYVNPTQNTTYSVVVNDGFNSVSGNIPVSIYPDPLIHLGPADSIVCIYDTIRLNAGNAGAQYLWSNGASSQTIMVQATGIAPETQTYSVKVTNENGCSATSSINISYSFNACTGIKDGEKNQFVRIYPNPSQGLFTVENTGLKENLVVSITNSIGQQVNYFTLNQSEPGKARIQVDLTNYPKGVYMVRFRGNSQLWTDKLVIE